MSLWNRSNQAGITLETDIGVLFSHKNCALTLVLIIMEVAWATVSTDMKGKRGTMAEIMNFSHRYHPHSQQRDSLCTHRLILWDMLPSSGARLGSLMEDLRRIRREECDEGEVNSPGPRPALVWFGSQLCKGWVGCCFFLGLGFYICIMEISTDM